MLGYIKPFPDELTLAEWRRYRAVYCGVCKRLGRRQGNFERLALSYDATFFALFFLALKSDEPATKPESCILHPFVKKAVAQEGPILDFSADLSCLLVYLKALDDLADGHNWRGGLLRALFRSGAEDFYRQYPSLVAEVSALLERASKQEQAYLAATNRCTPKSPCSPEDSPQVDKRSTQKDRVTPMSPDLSEQDLTLNAQPACEKACPKGGQFASEALSPEATAARNWAKTQALDIASYSGKALALLFTTAARLVADELPSDERYLHIIGAMAQALGEWVYLLDAYEDKTEDEQEGNFNPFRGLATEDFRSLAWSLMREKLQVVNQLAALLPYEKDTAIIENILSRGLYHSMCEIREKNWPATSDKATASQYD